MFDIKRFDEWVDAHYDNEEASELVQVVVENIVLAGALLGPKVTEAIGCEVVRLGIGSDRESYAAEEAHGYLDLGDPVSAVEVVFGEVELLEFAFGQKSNALKCYAMTGMIEGEDANATFVEKRNHLSELIEWGHLICTMVPVERKELPKFRSMSAAAQARFSIDLDRPVDVGSFAQLAALFRDGTADQVRKTLQNQVSARQLEVDERRELLPSSALQFLKGTTGFPSIWTLPEKQSPGGEEVETPVFIPVCPATFSAGERPFLPSERHSDGYRVGAGSSSRTFDDYWAALEWLSQRPEPAFQPLELDAPVRCKSEWARVDRGLLQNELAAISSSVGPAKSLTEQAHRRLLAWSAVRSHPLGHTAKLYRYRLEDGRELALEVRIGEPWLYLADHSLREIPDVEQSDVPGTKTGRNSNLEALPTFVGRSLRKFRLKSLADLDAVLSAL